MKKQRHMECIRDLPAINAACFPAVPASAALYTLAKNVHQTDLSES